MFSGDKKVQLALFTLKAEGIIHLTMVNDGKQSVPLWDPTSRLKSGQIGHYTSGFIFISKMKEGEIIIILHMWLWK